MEPELNAVTSLAVASLCTLAVVLFALVIVTRKYLVTKDKLKRTDDAFHNLHEVTQHLQNLLLRHGVKITLHVGSNHKIVYYDDSHKKKEEE
jgi:hypothetical protein